MTVGISLLIGIGVGIFVSGGTLAGVGSFIAKRIRKSKESELAKEHKQEKQIEFLTLNVKQLNKQLQLEHSTVAKTLDSFNVAQEQVDNFVINAKARKAELTDKQRAKTTTFKI